MKHSKEPWESLGVRAPQIIAEDEVICLMYSTNIATQKDEKVLANAQRIVVCVNACAGIRTEALDVGIVGKVLKTINDIDMVCCLKVWEKVR